MSESSPRIEVVISEVVRRVEVTVLEAGGGLHVVRLGAHNGAVPWTSLAGVPANLCTATLSEDAVNIEFHDLQGNLITRAPFLT